MAKRIERQELIDIDGLREAFAGYQADYKTAYENITRFNETMLRQSKEIKDTLRTMLSGAQGTDNGAQLQQYEQRTKKLVEQLQNQKQVTAALSAASLQHEKVMGGLINRQEQLLGQHKGIEGSTARETALRKRLASEIASLDRQLLQLNKTNNANSDTIKEVTGQYSRLQNELKESRAALRSLDGAFDTNTGKLNQSNRAAVDLAYKIKIADAALRGMDETLKVHTRNIGNYPKAVSVGFGGLKSLMGQLGIAATAAEVIGYIGETTLKVDSLDSSLKVVSNSTDLYAKRQAFLKKTSEDLGQSLIVIEDLYTLLTASSKGTRLEGDATDKIFESIVGTMGRLKRPAEQTQKALLAIGQMMSKGTVASEELRGQLAETLPGSFNIAARAIGVTTAQLGDMLKKGEVISADFLPKFAVELERTFNPNNEQRVEGLAAGLNRLKNEGVAWTKTLNIGDNAGAFISWITKMGASIRSLFTSAVDESTAKLNDQTESIRRLESVMPNLLTRYDELKSKSKLSADEQKELQSTINQIISLAPSAATGFDAYGNALDVNKGKVLSFAAAQRELNAELNKQAITDLKRQAGAGIAYAEDRQKTLNKGRELKGSFSRVFSRSNDRYQPLTDERKNELQGQVRQFSEQALNSARQIMAMGGVVEGQLRQYVERSGDATSKQLLLIDDYNKKIAKSGAEAAVILQKQGFSKEWEVKVKEVKELQKRLNQIISPTLPTPTEKPEGKSLTQAQLNKQLRDSVAMKKAASANELAILTNDRQDGLITEEKYLAERQRITLAGIEERQAVLKKAGKTETDEYVNLSTEKLNAGRQYKRDSLNLQLDKSSNDTTDQLADLGRKKEDGLITEAEFIGKRRDITVKGIQDRQAILAAAGQAETEQYKKLQTDITEAERVYSKDRNKLQEKAFKDSYEAVRRVIEQESGNIEGWTTDRLADLEVAYKNAQTEIVNAVANRQISESEGEERLYKLKLKFLKDTKNIAVEGSNWIITNTVARLQKLETQLRAEGKTEIEIADALNEEYRRIEKERNDITKQGADTRRKIGDAEAEEKKRKADQQKDIRNQTEAIYFQAAAAAANGYFEILQSFRDQDAEKLEKDKERELQMAGDNEEAKANINQKYAAQERALRRKQAVAQKEQAAFNVILSTTESIMKTFAQFGFVAGAPLAIAMGVLGAINLATVLAKPLPAFKTGKDANNKYEGPALVGEAGYELIETKKNGRLSYRLATEQITYLNKNDRVFSHSETKQILRYNTELAEQVRTAPGGSLHTATVATTGPTQGQLTAAFKDAIADLPIEQTIFDENGLRRYTQKKQQRTEWLNSYFSLPRKT